LCIGSALHRFDIRHACARARDDAARVITSRRIEPHDVFESLHNARTVLQGRVRWTGVRSSCNHAKEHAMNKQLPIDGQTIQVKLKEGEWQEATYRDDNFVDLYGLPLGFDKILEWRPLAADAPANSAGARRNTTNMPATRAG
jgi:hypothetical protein